MMNDPTLGGLLTPPDDLDHDDTAPDFEMLRRMFREAASASDIQRDHAKEDRDFYDGPHQIDDAARAKMRRMRVPETYCNKITSAIGATLGLLDSNQTEPEAVARNEEGEDAATIVTQILRYQADKTRLPAVLDATSEAYLVDGICAAKVEIDSRDNCLVTHIPYQNFYYDPCSMAYDFKDATYLIHAYWSDVSAVKRKWPDFADQIHCAGFQGEGPEDQPASAKFWIDPARRRVMIVDNFYIDAQTGKWRRAIYCHSTILEHGDTGYVDDDGEAVCPIEALSFHIMQEGERRGMVRNLVPLQRKINGFESALHKMAISNRVRVSSAAGTANPAERDLARREAQKTDGAMPEGYDIVANDHRFSDMASAVAGMKQEIDDAAPGRAAMAAGGANTSGRARQLLQQSGLSELSRAFGKFEDFEERVYRQMWFRARQFMTDQMMIRITDNAGARQTLSLNVPVMETQHRPVMAPQIDATGKSVIGPDGQPVISPAVHPVTGQVRTTPVPTQIATHNHVAAMDVDINLTVVQTADTLRDEGKQKLLEWSQKTGISLLDPSFKFAIKFLGIPDQEEILAAYEECFQEAQQLNAPAEQAKAQAAQQMRAVQAGAAQAHAQREQAAAARDQTLAQKHQVDIQSTELSNTWKAAMLNSGHNPDTP